MLTVDKDVTFTELQKLIYKAVRVPGERQKISVGFPPTLLVQEDFEKKIVPLHHGDTITLEILSNVGSVGMKGTDNYAFYNGNNSKRYRQLCLL